MKTPVEKLMERFDQMKGDPIHVDEAPLPVFKPRDPNCPPLRIWDAAIDLPCVAEFLGEHLKECEECRRIAPKLLSGKLEF